MFTIISPTALPPALERLGDSKEQVSQLRRSVVDKFPCCFCQLLESMEIIKSAAITTPTITTCLIKSSSIAIHSNTAVHSWPVK